MFVDQAKIKLKAGNGGNGLVSFRREKYVAAGGPDGGDGGRGGSIIFKTVTHFSTLSDFRYKNIYHAPNGEDGKSGKRSGKDGENLIIEVPEGTVIRDAESGRIIADMTPPCTEFVALKGGNGGWGNTHFATPTRQAPKFARNGQKGKETEVLLELKLLADVGLAGFPNVGKSTLLSVVSEARPKVANYHFTTLEPNLGVVNMGEGRSFVMADIPGLIEGAHEGIGLGHEFLRHIERTRLLIHMVDVSGIEGRNPILDFETINREIALYNEELSKRPMIVAANKVDIMTAPEAYEAFKAYIKEKGYTLFEISAATRHGVRELMEYTASRLAELPPIPIFEPEEVPEIEMEEEIPFEIIKEGDLYIVEGPWIERMTGSVNFEDYESLQYFQRVLRKGGVIDALIEAGVKEGDPVMIGELEFDFVN